MIMIINNKNNDNNNNIDDNMMMLIGMITKFCTDNDKSKTKKLHHIFII